MTLDSPWLKVMLEEIERKRRDERESREEALRRDLLEGYVTAHGLIEDYRVGPEKVSAWLKENQDLKAAQLAQGES